MILSIILMAEDHTQSYAILLYFIELSTNKIISLVVLPSSSPHEIVDGLLSRLRRRTTFTFQAEGENISVSLPQMYLSPSLRKADQIVASYMLLCHANSKM